MAISALGHRARIARRAGMDITASPTQFVARTRIFMLGSPAGCGTHRGPKIVLIAEREVNPTCVDRKRRAKRSRQVKNIFLGANQGIRPGGGSCGFKVSNFSARIPMMIGEPALPHNGTVPPFEVIEKSRGISDATKSKKLESPALAFGQRLRHQRHSEHPIELNVCIKDRCLRES